MVKKSTKSVKPIKKKTPQDDPRYRDGSPAAKVFVIAEFEKKS